MNLNAKKIIGGYRCGFRGNKSTVNHKYRIERIEMKRKQSRLIALYRLLVFMYSEKEPDLFYWFDPYEEGIFG